MGHSVNKKPRQINDEVLLYQGSLAEMREVERRQWLPQLL